MMGLMNKTENMEKTMKRAVMIGGLISMCMLSATAAHADQTGSYASAQLSVADYSGLGSSGLALTANYGMPMASLLNLTVPASTRNKLFLEAEGSLSLSDPSDTIYGVHVKASYYTLGGYAVYKRQLGDRFYGYGRLGVVYESVKASGTYLGTTIVGSQSDFGLSYGVGATYVLSPTMSLRGDYTVVSSDISHLSLGVQIPLQ